MSSAERLNRWSCPTAMSTFSSTATRHRSLSWLADTSTVMPSTEHFTCRVGPLTKFTADTTQAPPSASAASAAAASVAASLSALLSLRERLRLRREPPPPLPPPLPPPPASPPSSPPPPTPDDAMQSTSLTRTNHVRSWPWHRNADSCSSSSGTHTCSGWGPTGNACAPSAFFRSREMKLHTRWREARAPSFACIADSKAVTR